MRYGIDVVSIQPGPIQSKLWDKNVGSMDRFKNTIYSTMIRNTDNIMREAQRAALPAEVISALIDHIIRSPRPKVSYMVTKHKWRTWLLTHLVPARLTDRLLWKRLNRPVKGDDIHADG
jgi:NAD(P)-dependent dehydrogenase (short-subunit alcohol dehydrogenase family)